MKRVALLALILCAGLYSQVKVSGKAAVVGRVGLNLSPNISISSIAVGPTAQSQVMGSTVGYTATLTLSNGQTVNVTQYAVWSYTNPPVAHELSLTSTENAQCFSDGTTQVTAQYGAFSNSTSLTCTPGVPPAVTLTSVAVAPASPSVGVGTSVLYTATGTFSDGTSRDITSTVTWASSNTAKVKLGALTTIQDADCIAAGTSSISATDPTTLLVGSQTQTCNAVLSSINVNPSVGSILVGQTQTFAATCNFSDGSSSDCTLQAVWSSSATSFATIPANPLLSPNTATGISAGSSTITAAIGATSGTATLTVSNPAPPPPTLNSLTVTPATKTVNVGGILGYQCTANYSDGSTQNCTAAASWASSSPTIVQLQLPDAIVGSNYSQTLTGTGGTPYEWVTPAAQCSAGQIDLVDYEVLPLPNRNTQFLSGGTNPRYYAVGQGIFWHMKSATGWPSDIQLFDSTTIYNWMTENNDAVEQTKCNLDGYSKCFNDPKAYKRAATPRPALPRCWTPGTTITLMQPATLQSGNVNPQIRTTNCELDGEPLKYLNNVKFVTYGPQAVSWSPTQKIVNDYYYSGDVNGVYQNLERRFLDYNGTPRRGWDGWELYSWNGLSYDLVDSSYETTLASGAVPTPGLGCTLPTLPFQVLPQGTNLFSAPSLNLGDSTGTISGIPLTAGSYPFTSQQLDNGGTYHFQNLQIDVDPIGSTPLQKAKCIAGGTATITATVAATSGSTPLTCQNPPPTLSSLAITPGTASILVAATQSFLATGTFSDGTKKDVTTTATWASSLPTLATIPANPVVSPNLATGVSAGTVTISAAIGAISSNATLTVTIIGPPPPTLSSVTLSPKPCTQVSGGSCSYILTANYSDGSTKDVTTDPATVWTTSNPANVVMSGPSGPITITGQTGTVLSGLHITSTTGNCITVTGSTNITIKNSEIGPCGTSGPAILGNGISLTNDTTVNIYDNYIHPETLSSGCCDHHDGIFGSSGNSGVTIQGNVIAYGESNIEFTANNANITVTGNFLLNPRGPLPRGQNVQCYGTDATHLCANASVTNNYTLASTTGFLYPDVQEDSISFGFTNTVSATSNYVTGGHSVSGCGIIADDAANSATFQSNRLLNTGQCGIGIADGTNQLVDANKVYNTTPVVGGGNTAIYTWKQYTPACGPTTVSNNIADEIRTDGTHSGFFDGGGCSTTLVANTFGAPADALLTPISSVFPTPLVPPQPKNCTANSPYTTNAGSPCPVVTNTEQGKCLVGGGATSVITGAFGGFSDNTTQTCNTSTPVLQTIAVTPANPSVAVGASIGFTATGTFSDGTTPNITLSSTWKSSAPLIAQVQSLASPQSVKCLSGGTATISATSGAVTGSTSVTCIIPPPPSIGFDGYCPSGTPTWGSTDHVAALPLTCYNTDPTNRPTSGTVRAVTQATWTSVWAATNCDDVVEMAAGATFSGGALTIPSKVCAAGHYRTLRPANFNANFPAYGLPAGTDAGGGVSPCQWGIATLPGYVKRDGTPLWKCPTPANVGGTIQATSQSAALILAGPISGLQIEGTHILRNSSVFFSDVILKSGSGFDHIILDRNWCSSTVAGSTNRCFDSSTISFDAAVGNFVSDFLCIAGGPGGLCSSDAQGFSDGRNNTGVQDCTKKWVGNFVSATSENLFSGGGGANIVPCDFEIRLNYLFKPMTWNPSDVSYAFGAIGQPLVKNLLEFKNGNRVLIEGNVLRNTWVGFDQNGSAMLMTPKSQNGACSACAVTNVTARDNYITTANYPFQFLTISSDSGAFATAGNSFSFHDMVADNLGYATCFKCASNSGNGYDGGLNSTSNPLAPTTFVLKHIYRSHITLVRAPGAANKAGMLGVSGGKSGSGLEMDDYTWTNNFSANQRGGSTGISNPADACSQNRNCNCGTTTPLASLNACFISYTFAGNCIVNDGGTVWPGSNIVSSTATETSELVNYNNGLMLPGGDFHLKAASACHNQATDGFDPGADINTLLNRIQGVNAF